MTTSYGEITYFIYAKLPDGNMEFLKNERNVRTHKKALEMFYDLKRSTPEGTEVYLVQQRMEYKHVAPTNDEAHDRLRKRKKPE